MDSKQAFAPMRFLGLADPRSRSGWRRRPVPRNPLLGNFRIADSRQTVWFDKGWVSAGEGTRPIP